MSEPIDHYMPHADEQELRKIAFDLEQELQETRAIAEAYRDNLCTTIRAERKSYRLPWEPQQPAP